jgi:hypothetical protein
MAKAKKRIATRKKSSKRGKARAKPARNKAKTRQVRGRTLKSTARKKRLSKTAAETAPGQAPAAEDTIIDVIDERAPGVVWG